MAEEEAVEARQQFKRLAILIAASCFDMIGFAMIMPLLPFYGLQMHATPTMIGFIIASFSVAQLVSAPLWGRVSDHYGRRPALLIGLAASSLAYLVFGVANTVALLFASRIIQGAGGGTTGVAQAYVADTVRPTDRARALGWLSAATSVGVMIGPVIGSLASYMGRSGPGLVAATLCGVNVFFAWRWLPESRNPSAAGPGKPQREPVWRAAASMLRHPGGTIPRLIWVYSVGMLAFSCLTAVLSLYLDAEFGFTEKSIGYVFLYIGVLSLVMRSVCLGPIVDRIGESWAMRVGTVILVFGLAAYPLARNIWGLAAVMAVVPVGTALVFPATTALLSRASEKSETGLTMGMAQTYAGLARMLAPPVATSVFERVSHDAPFYVAGGIVALVSIMAFLIRVPDHPAA